MNAIIQKIPLNFVKEFDEIKLNSNNHWIDNKKPENYEEKIEELNTRTWVNQFHTSYQTFFFDKKDLDWLWKAFEIGRQTQLFPGLYKEELEETLEKYNRINKIFNGTKYFVRTEKVSLKYGLHGVGPYTTLKQIIESMVTTIDAHKCFNRLDKKCKIYLFPWLENMNPEKEFRVFIYEGNVTAISQQHIYDENNWLSSLSEQNIQEIIQKIVYFYENKVTHKIIQESFVMDCVLLGEDNEPYFIEPNVFGKEYASGSALFHWINDGQILYDHNTIYFRYIPSNNKN